MGKQLLLVVSFSIIQKGQFPTFLKKRYRLQNQCLTIIFKYFKHFFMKKSVIKIGCLMAIVLMSSCTAESIENSNNETLKNLNLFTSVANQAAIDDLTPPLPITDVPIDDVNPPRP